MLKNIRQSMAKHLDCGLYAKEAPHLRILHKLMKSNNLVKLQITDHLRKNVVLYI